MNKFCIIAHPNYFKRVMNWDMKHMEIRHTSDRLVAFIASENVPDDLYHPWKTSFFDPEKTLDNPLAPYLGIGKE